jgi:hypothetical protein
MQRRQLLRLSALSVSLAAPFSAMRPFARAAAPGGVLAFTEVRDAGAAPLIEAGDHLLIDTAQMAFSGEGLYLYPDWGRPRAYRVRETVPGRLGFFDPARPALLWSMPAAASRFAGRVSGRLAARDEQAIAFLHAAYSELSVPEFPHA